MSSDTSIVITFGGTAIDGTLTPSATTDALVAQLPLELSFDDHGNQEKVADLPAPLSIAGMPEGSGAGPGVIGYYAPNQVLVLYYDEVPYFTGIVPIGTFEDVAAVRDAAPFVATITIGDETS